MVVRQRTSEKVFIQCPLPNTLVFETVPSIRDLLDECVFVEAGWLGLHCASSRASILAWSLGRPRRFCSYVQDADKSKALHWPQQGLTRSHFTLRERHLEHEKAGRRRFRVDGGLSIIDDGRC